MAADKPLDLVGNTPLVELRNMQRRGEATILAKLEMFNLSGSIKDRIVKYIVERAERTGALKKDQVIVEATSGNTGIALSTICIAKGYRVKVVMPESATEERRRIIKSSGAELIPVEDEYKAIRLAEKLAEDEGGFLLNQFGSPLNVEAHYMTTAEEILNQSGGEIDAFVCGIGTGGTITGTGRRLKEYSREIEVVGCEPEVQTRIGGLLNFTDSNYKPPILDLSIIDEVVRVRDDDAFQMVREIARREGLLVGPSSGAVMHVAMRKAEELGEGKRIVVIFADGGARYLSSGIFSQ
ncbi:cysteine synthase family protein [Candidatus Bathyarchaeota archaeon]|nr:cysteine synthase family protein [Candidatus Bathyarchaeota archaeon]